MGRSPCCDKNGLKKGPWTPEEDAKLTHYIQMHGPGNWRTLPKIAGLQRCGKSCRLRWTNYLRPDIKRGRFSFEEEETIIQLHSVLGNKWSAIAARLPGRTDNEIKNYWNTHIRKRLLRMGIDPVTHAPRLDLSDLSSLLISSPQLNNLSNLIRLQTLMSNPEALRVALSLLSPQNDQNQLFNTHQQFQQQLHENLQAPVIPPNPFDNVINQQIPWTFATSSLNNHSQSHMHMGMGSTNSSTGQVLFHDNLITASTSDQMKPKCSDDNSSFQTLNSNNNNNNSQNFSFDSVMSTPPNTASTLVSGSTEDERDSFCSNLFKFEIPESFDFDHFM